MGERIHFIGIGGAGMSAIAHVMNERGAAISGSDQKKTATTERLEAQGIKVTIGHDSANLDGAALVVYSAAIPKDNPERAAAESRGIETIDRAQMLGRLMSGYENRVAITGTHGKTTTTSMASLVLSEAGLDPTVLIGGDLAAIGGNAHVGNQSLFVTEACEAFDSFLNLYPSVAAITNIDADHLDFHGTLEKIIESFKGFLAQVDPGGVVIACVDDANVRGVLVGLNRRIVSYSTQGPADLQAVNIAVDSPQASYDLVRNGQNLGRITLGVPGVQNVANSLAAAAIGFEYGADFEDIRSALAKFTGTGRRFEILGTPNDIMIVDDYAHHPREIFATLSAARAGWKRRLIAVFQPHLYSRTQFFTREFAESLALADLVIVTDVYAAREKPIEGVSGRMIFDLVQGPEKRYMPEKSEIASALQAEVRPGDMVITLGAGDIRVVGESLLAALWSVSATAGEVATK
jgi:UDP-N-acetylmuramate--alanine ligase